MEYFYDQTGQLSEVVWRDLSFPEDLFWRQLTYHYDSMGNLIEYKITEYLPDGRSSIWLNTWQFDRRGDLVEDAFILDLDADGSREIDIRSTNAYDVQGNLLQVDSRSGEDGGGTLRLISTTLYKY